jgi:NADH:ubiquinone oxidoreductase subunit F (NADH-binding)
MTATLAVSMLDGAPTQTEHEARFGPLPRIAPDRLLAMIEASGLKGRGGAKFPAHRKLRALAAQHGRKVVVGNGAEGEPASAKDRMLLAANPHLVLDGLHLVGQLTGAQARFLYAPAIPAAADDRGVHCVQSPRYFLAGEESALASKLSGGPGLPTYKRPPVFERGVQGRPTLVHNVETLAHIALIARYGPDWFRATESMLVTVTRADGIPRVAQVPVNSRIGDLVGASVRSEPASGAMGTVAEVLVGGYHGGWLPAALAADRPLATMPGAGVLVGLGPDRCGLVETARVATYLATESARQCGPCLSALPLIAEALRLLARRGRQPGARERLERWAGLVVGRGGCHHPDGSVRFVRSALQVFAPEIALHERGLCRASTFEPFLPVT